MSGTYSPDPGPMVRLAEVQGDENAPSVIFQRLCDGETLREIARAWQVPKGRFIEWFTTEHGPLYDAALKVLADELAHESVGISDGGSEDVARDRLRVDTRLKLASKWDRKRYGEQAEAVRTTPVVIQIANLRGGGDLEVAVPAALPERAADEL